MGGSEASRASMRSPSSASASESSIAGARSGRSGKSSWSIETVLPPARSASMQALWVMRKREGAEGLNESRLRGFLGGGGILEQAQREAVEPVLVGVHEAAESGVVAGQ